MQSGDTGGNQRRGVGHCTHDACRGSQPAREVGAADAGGDADHQLAADNGREAARDFPQLLGFDREHDAIGILRRRSAVARSTDAELLRQPFQGFRQHIDGVNDGGRPAFGDQTTDDCGRHIAAADKKDVHVLKQKRER